MYVFDEEPLRSLERMMRGIPNFTPRGQGVAVMYGYGDAAGGGFDPKKGFQEILAGIRYPPLEQRVREHQEENGGKRMEFRNEKHRAAFEEAVLRLGRGGNARLAALYLLTADHRLWMAARHACKDSRICFGKIRLKGSTEDGYALYCAAKDLYLGTKNLTIRELSDPGLVAPKTFALILNGMAIRRFGPGVVHFSMDRYGDGGSGKEGYSHNGCGMEKG